MIQLVQSFCAWAQPIYGVCVQINYYYSYNRKEPNVKYESMQETAFMIQAKQRKKWTDIHTNVKIGGKRL